MEMETDMYKCIKSLDKNGNSGWKDAGKVGAILERSVLLEILTIVVLVLPLHIHTQCVLHTG